MHPSASLLPWACSITNNTIVPRASIQRWPTSTGSWRRDNVHAESAWERVTHIPPWAVHEQSLAQGRVHNPFEMAEARQRMPLLCPQNQRHPTNRRRVHNTCQTIDREIEHGVARLAAASGPQPSSVAIHPFTRTPFSLT